MHGQKALLILAVSSLLAQKPARAPVAFSGASALAFTGRVVRFGPRPPGSAAIGRLREYIVAELKRDGCEITLDPFTAATPRGPIKMTNIVARFPGKSGRAVAITGHYDTKWMPDTVFVGANDGGASAGFLLELARVLARTQLQNEVYLVWFDGEEAFETWSDTDGIYGSRHLAARWSADSTISRLKALINVDMIGDRDLDILQDMKSSAALRRLAWDTAAELGYSAHFQTFTSSIDDDHIPFLMKGVNALDLIDLNYGPSNSYWHTSQDTMDKLSAESFQVVGTVVLRMIRRLE
jgi:Zn-dependent M28 family amino/carboxypeptidase